MTVMWDEELKLAFGLWIQTYCPITTKGQLLQFYGPCNLIDGISILIYSLLSRKVKWHSKNKQLPNYWCLYVYATGWISYCLYHLLPIIILYHQFTFHVLWNQKEDLFWNAFQFWLPEICRRAGEYKTSALEEVFSHDLLFCKCDALPPNFPVAVHYIWANYIWTREADCLSSRRILFKAQLARMCYFLFERCTCVCVYSLLCLQGILNAEYEEAKLGHAITQLSSPPSVAQMLSLPMLFSWLL